MHTSYHLFLPPDVPSVVRRPLRAGPSSTQAKRDRTRSTPYARLSDLEFRVLEPAAAGQSLDDPLPRVTFEGIRSGLAKDVAPQTPPGLPAASPTGVAEHASPAEWNASYHQGRISALQDSQQPQKASTSKPRRSIKSSRIGHSTRSIVPESSEEEDGPASDPDEMSASGSILEDWNGRMDGDETTGYGITWEAMKSGLDSGRPGLDYGSHKLPTTWMSPSGAESPFDTRYESQSQSPSQSQSQTSASILPPSFSYLSRLSSLPSLATLLRLSTSLNAAPPPPRVTLLAAVLQLSEVRTVSATFGAPSRWPERFPPGKQAMCEMMVVQPEQEVGQGHKTTIIKCWGDVAVAFTEGGGDGRIQRGDVVLLSNLTYKVSRPPGRRDAAPIGTLSIATHPSFPATYRIVYRTLPRPLYRTGGPASCAACTLLQAERSLESQVCDRHRAAVDPEDARFRPDARLGESIPGLKKVLRMAGWCAGYLGA